MRNLLLATVLAAVPIAANATFIVNDTASTKIFFNKADDTNVFTGNVATNNTGPLVNFNSQGLVDVANGFSNIKPSDSIQGLNGDFTNLVITPTVEDWSAFTFRGQFGSLSTTDNLTLTVKNQFGTVEIFHFDGLAGPDTDFADIGITSIDNQRINQVTITAGPGDNFKELKQFEVTQSGVINPQCPPGEVCVPTPTIDTPEPWSIAILGAGLVGIGLIRRKA